MIAEIQGLESRTMLAAIAPSANEVYMVALLNRSRGNPEGEAKRLGLPSINEGLTITLAKGARQPLAIDGFLTSSARDYAVTLLDPPKGSNPHKGTLDHRIGGTTAGTRAVAHGFASTFVGENLSVHGQGLNTAMIDTLEDQLFRDFGPGFEVVGRGHRLNLLDGQWGVVGVGLTEGPFGNKTSSMAVQDFSTGGPFFTGVLISDGTKDDDFYQPGEGLKKMTVTARRLSDGKIFKVKAWPSGGYALKVEPGAYAVTASGSALGAAVTYNAVISTQNVKLDFIKPGKGDQTPPTAMLNASTMTAAGAKQQFQVFFNDANAIKTSTIGNGDVEVSGPNAFKQAAALVSKTPAANSTGVIATFSVTGPGGTWGSADNGSYTVKIGAKKVNDVAGKAVAKATLGKFQVNITGTLSAQMPVALPAGSPFMAGPASDSSGSILDGADEDGWMG